MANSDYVLRSNGEAFCPSGLLSGPVSELATVLPMVSMGFQGASSIAVGQAALVGEEIVGIQAVGTNSITVLRGCMDTIPAPHGSGDTVWFIDRLGVPATEYTAVEPVGVKPLPYLAGGNQVTTAASPPQGITFDWRFARPYPPGDFQIDGSPWFNDPTLDVANPDLVLTWAHRDRIAQEDVLIGHASGSIGPEAGTTYTLRIYDEFDALLRTVSGIAVATTTYSWATARADLGITLDAGPAFVAAYGTLHSVRGALESKHGYRFDFQVGSASA